MLTLFVLIPLALVGAVLTVSSFGLVVILVPFVLFSVWFTVRLMSAWYVNNTVKVSEKTFPEVHAAIADAKTVFGYNGPVDAYVYEEGSYNAMIVALLRRKFLLINSELLKEHNTHAELRFIVGRFIGSL
ncbi:MAG TPA: hypothetical protein VFR34_03270, partial [Paracoccaceae bacterium]|nr:hypothetical protein [Paracoccaceae bacterium]